MLDIERLGIIAKEKGVTAKHLCDLIGKQRGYIKDLRAGNAKFQPQYAYVWADALGTTAEYLCGETDDPNPPAVPQEDIKVALFGGENCTDEEWEQVKEYVEFLKSKRK